MARSDGLAVMAIVPHDQISAFLRREVSRTSDAQEDDGAADALSKTPSSHTMSAVDGDEVPQADDDLLGV